MTTYTRKTRDEWQIMASYGHGYEVENTEDTRRDGLRSLREYRENGSGSYYLLKRRVPLDSLATTQDATP